MRRRDPNYDPELAKQIMANTKAMMAKGADGPLPTGLTGLRARWRMGFIGTEPYQARRPVARTYVATWGALAAIALTLTGSVPAGGAVTIACLLIGAPKAWTWTHDRLSVGAWLAALALTAIGWIMWATGGASAHGTLNTHTGSSTALDLAAIGGVVALLSDYRRWGTAGSNVAGNTPRTPAERAVLAEAAAREGAGHEYAPVNPASDEDTARALDDFYRRDH